MVAVRQLLSKANIKNFILSYCCSGQTTIEGTWKYYELLGIKKEDVVVDEIKAVCSGIFCRNLLFDKKVTGYYKKKQQ